MYHIAVSVFHIPEAIFLLHGTLFIRGRVKPFYRYSIFKVIKNANISQLFFPFQTYRIILLFSFQRRSKIYLCQGNGKIRQCTQRSYIPV